MQDIISQMAHPVFATWSFIICMFTLCAQGIVVVRKVNVKIKLIVEILNAITWFIIALVCLSILHIGWHTKSLEPLYCFMYIVRVFASFCMSVVSLDLAAQSILQKK